MMVRTHQERLARGEGLRTTRPADPARIKYTAALKAEALSPVKHM
jgi:hypothetical protein